MSGSSRGTLGRLAGARSEALAVKLLAGTRRLGAACRPPEIVAGHGLAPGGLGSYLWRVRDDGAGDRRCSATGYRQVLNMQEVPQYAFPCNVDMQVGSIFIE